MTVLIEAPEHERPSRVTPHDVAQAGATRRARDSRLKVWMGAIAVLIVVLAVAFARVLPLPDPNQTDLAQRRLPPLTDGHLFGTDQLGRDLLVARVVTD